MPYLIDLRQAVYALTDALDLVGIDKLHHSKRVSFMALGCGRLLNLGPETQRRLFYAALLHDCGVSSTRLHQRLVSELDWEGCQEHCETGYHLLKDFAPLADLAEIILYHHTHWRDLPAHLDPLVARLSNLIFLADRVDALSGAHYGIDILNARHAIREQLRSFAGDFFEPGLVGTFLELSTSEAFWSSLESRQLEHFLREMGTQQEPIPLSVEAMRHFAAIFARIVDAKSPFTEQHSEGVARLAHCLGEWAGLPHFQCEKLEIAGLLHDLGKLRIPDEILEKRGPLTEAERSVMQHHSFETYRILGHITGLEDVATWAAYHHQTLDGSGYPFHLPAEQLTTEARIIAIADIFQALAQERPYRRALPPQSILDHLQQRAAAGALDGAIVTLIAEHLEESMAVATQGFGEPAPVRPMRLSGQSM